MSVCIQIYGALYVLVNLKVECTSQRDWGWGWDVLSGDGVGMEKIHGDGVGIGLIFNTVSLFST